MPQTSNVLTVVLDETASLRSARALVSDCAQFGFALREQGCVEAFKAAKIKGNRVFAISFDKALENSSDMATALLDASTKAALKASNVVAVALQTDVGRTMQIKNTSISRRENGAQIESLLSGLAPAHNALGAQKEQGILSVGLVLPSDVRLTDVFDVLGALKTEGLLPLWSASQTLGEGYFKQTGGLPEGRLPLVLRTAPSHGRMSAEDLTAFEARVSARLSDLSGVVHGGYVASSKGNPQPLKLSSPF